MKKSRFQLGEYQPLHEGLSELESDFLKMELKENPYRTVAELRKTAKRKAWIQDWKWRLQDTMISAGVVSFFVTMLLIFLIWVV
ncbi:hypothetical protein J2T17_007122 [Paenibacillus mucilaginosus]|uniref:hypothetical protein n=1 Tax=Paenibacillus mucilaginosus TaxID=61624 RepID=UPI003D23E0EC